MLRKLIYGGLGFLGSFEARALEQASLIPREVQLAKLKSLVARNASSQFGREHGFSGIRTFTDFKQAVPLRQYDDFASYIDRIAKGESSVLTAESPVMLATTSGTTGAQKFIPVTEHYLREFRYSSTASGYHLFKEHPAVNKGVVLSVFSPAEQGRTEGGIPYGAISGQLYLSEPRAIKKHVAPIPYEVYSIKDYESRYYTILRLALILPLSCIYTLNPSTIHVLCKKLETYGEQLVADVFEGGINPPEKLTDSVMDSIKSMLKADRSRAGCLQNLLEQGKFAPQYIWETLQFVSCWTKAAASFYLNPLKEYFGNVPIRDISYGASEGRGSAYIGRDRQILSLRSHFYEFIPEEEIDSDSPTTLLCDELEEGKNYYILFTTSAGLYRYHINDVIKVVGFHNRAPLIEFQFKGGNICSFTGEKITEYQVTEAMTGALSELGAKVRFFTVIPEFNPEPHYRLLVEPESDGNPELSGRLARVFDEKLKSANSEYADKRDSLRLTPVTAETIEPGTYDSLRLELTSSGVPDAQIKLSHLNPKDSVKQFFEDRVLHKLASKG